MQKIAPLEMFLTFSRSSYHKQWPPQTIIQFILI